MSALHQTRHEMLYKGLRELISDYMTSTGHIPTTIIELLDWSKSQIKAQWTDTLNDNIDRADVQRHLKQEITV